MIINLVIQAAQDSTKAPWRIQYILKDIHCWESVGIHLTFNNVFREANRVANWLAHFGHTTIQLFLRDTCFSLELQGIISDDVVGHSFVKKDV